MSGRGVTKPAIKKKLSTPMKKKLVRVKRVKRVPKGSVLKNTVNIRLAAAAPQLPGVSSGNSGGGSSSSSAGAPASTTILTAGVRDDNKNDRILQALARIEAGGPRAQAGTMQNTLQGELFIPVPGPPGPRGERGERGLDSTVAGPRGERGERGLDSTVPGPRGERGERGLDSTVPGPPGRDSTVPGPRGERGEQGLQGVSSFVYQPNGALMPEQQRQNLGRQDAAVVPQDTSEDRLVTALERMADRTQARLQPTERVIEQPLAIEDAGRGTAQKRPANQLAAAIDEQAQAEQAAMDTGDLRAQLDEVQRARRNVMRQALDGNLAVPLSVPLSGIGLTAETTGSIVRAGPIIEQMPDPSSELAVMGGRELVPDGRITAQRSAQLAQLRAQISPPRLMARVTTPPRIAGQMVVRGARELEQYYPTTEDDGDDGL
jgi:hypothetical protein